MKWWNGPQNLLKRSTKPIERKKFIKSDAEIFPVGRISKKKQIYVALKSSKNHHFQEIEKLTENDNNDFVEACNRAMKKHFRFGKIEDCDS